MKPAQIFDVVYKRVREIQMHQGHKPAPPSSKGCDGGTRPIAGRHDYVADFEIAGRRVLPQSRRLQVFKLYYCQGIPYREAMKATGLKSGTFDWYCAEIKKSVGAELERVGLYPPHLYKERNRG